MLLFGIVTSEFKVVGVDGCVSVTVEVAALSVSYAVVRILSHL